MSKRKFDQLPFERILVRLRSANGETVDTGDLADYAYRFHGMPDNRRKRLSEAVNRLRVNGYPIEGSNKDGYCLTDPTFRKLTVNHIELIAKNIGELNERLNGDLAFVFVAIHRESSMPDDVSIWCNLGWERAKSTMKIGLRRADREIEGEVS